MKFLAIALAICTSYNIVSAVLPRTRPYREKTMAITALYREVPDDEIVEVFRRKVYDAIESVKWNTKFKLWADLGIRALSYPISKVNEMAKSVSYQPNYDMWLNKFRQMALEKSRKVVKAGLSKITNVLDELHAYVKLYVDKLITNKLTSEGANNEDFIYMDYNDYIKE